MIAVDWLDNRMVAVYLAAGFVVAVAITFLVMRKTVRTRIRTEREIRDDTDINDWLVVFDWSRKTLYMPTILVSLAAFVVMLIWELSGGPEQQDFAVPRVVGGVWFAVFFLNFLIEEFQISVKTVLILALATVGLLVWLFLMEWTGGFFAVFRKVSVAVSSTGFLLVALLGLLAVATSWIKGLFYYVVFTPNYMNIQWGPTESGDHISREDFNTHVDTVDILERLMGFGRIVIVFKDQKRPPMTLLVWRIGQRAQALEKVRGKFAIDMNHPGRASGEPADRPGDRAASVLPNAEQASATATEGPPAQQEPPGEGKPGAGPGSGGQSPQVTGEENPQNPG